MHKHFVFLYDYVISGGPQIITVNMASYSAPVSLVLHGVRSTEKKSMLVLTGESLR